MRAAIIPTLAALCFALPAQAAVVTPFDDTDGQFCGVCGARFPDFDAFPNTTYTFTLSTDGTESGGIYRFAVLLTDPIELTDLTHNSVISASVSFDAINSTATSLFYDYVVNTPVPEALISFDVTTTAALGLRPHDELPDLIFTDTLGTLGVYDPISGTNVVDLNVDFQAVPLPLPGAMLLGAGAATGYAYKKMIKPSARSATEAIHDALGFDLANAWQKFSEGITNTTDDIGERMDRLNKRMGEHLPRYSRSHRDDEDGDGSAGAHEEYKEDVTADYCRGCPLKSQQGSANNMDL